MAAPCGQTHEQTSPQRHAGDTHTHTHTHTHLLHASLLEHPFAKTPCGQHRLSTDENRHFTITPTHSLHIQLLSLSLSPCVYFYIYIHSVSPSLFFLPSFLSLLCFPFLSKGAGFSQFFQPDRQMATGSVLIYTVALNMISPISQEFHLQNQQSWFRIKKQPLADRKSTHLATTLAWWATYSINKPHN